MTEHQFDRIAQIAHKLRTPLTVVVSTVNNLLDGAFGPLNADQKRWLEKLCVHMATFESLLNEVLEMLGVQMRDAASGERPDNRSVVGGKNPSLAHTEIFDWGQRKPKILIVDDEPDIVEIIDEGLRMEGFSPITASTGDECLRLALENHPDLVLMDVHLKDQNGIDVCQKLKSQLPTFTPVLLVTGQEHMDRRFTGDKNDPDDLLTKPFQMQELFSRVRSMLRLKKLYDDLVSVAKKAA